MSLVSHLECARCATEFEPGKVYNLCTCGSPLWVRYHLRRVAGKRWRNRLASRPPSLWRYREVLPVTQEASVVSLGEGLTPLIHAQRLGERLGLANLYLKDESLNPTGSFKARGLAVAVSMARELGIKKLRFLRPGTRAGRWPPMQRARDCRRRSSCRRTRRWRIAWNARSWEQR